MTEILSIPTLLIVIFGIVTIVVGLVATIVGFAEKAVILWIPAMAVLLIGLLFAFAPDLVLEAVTTPAYGKLHGLD